MADSKFTDADVTTFLQQLVELGGAYTVDNTPAKYVRRPDPKNPEGQVFVTVDYDGKPTKLALYGTKAADAVIVNPFSEGEEETAQHGWLYATLQAALAIHLIKLMRTLIAMGADSHKKTKGKDTHEVSTLAIKYLGKLTPSIDEKMKKEFNTIASSPSKFFSIHYNKNTKKCTVNCNICNPKQRVLFTPSQVRKSTWKVLESLLLSVLQVKSLDEFTYEPQTLGIPAFEGLVHVLVNVYMKLAEPLQITGVDLPHLAELQSQLQFLPNYYSVAKWCVTSNLEVPTVTAPTPGVAPFTSEVPTVGGTVPVVGVPASSNVPSIVNITPTMNNYRIAAPVASSYQGVPTVSSLFAGSMKVVAPVTGSASAMNTSRNPFCRP